MARDNDIPQIYKLGPAPNTRVALSQKNRIFSTPYSQTGVSSKQVGVLSQFNVSESRSVDTVRGIGFGDRVIELVPGITEPASLSINRTLLYTSSIIQELGYRGGVDGLVRSLRHHRWPFDIYSELVFSEIATKEAAGSSKLKTESSGIYNNSVNYAVLTYYLGCWLESYGVDFGGEGGIVAENCSAKATDVTDGSSMWGNTVDTYGDVLDAGNNPITQNGAGSSIYRPRPL